MTDPSLQRGLGATEHEPTVEAAGRQPVGLAVERHDAAADRATDEPARLEDHECHGAVVGPGNRRSGEERQREQHGAAGRWTISWACSPENVGSRSNRHVNLTSMRRTVATAAMFGQDRYNKIKNMRKPPCPCSRTTSLSSPERRPASAGPSRSVMPVKARTWCCSISTTRTPARSHAKSARPAAKRTALRSMSRGTTTASRSLGKSPTRSDRSRSWSTMPASIAAMLSRPTAMPCSATGTTSWRSTSTAPSM